MTNPDETVHGPEKSERELFISVIEGLEEKKVFEEKFVLDLLGLSEKLLEGSEYDSPRTHQLFTALRARIQDENHPLSENDATIYNRFMEDLDFLEEENSDIHVFGAIMQIPGTNQDLYYSFRRDKENRYDIDIQVHPEVASPNTYGTVKTKFNRVKASV